MKSTAQSANVPIKPIYQMGQRPPNFSPQTAISPLLLAQSQSQADRQIREELKRDAETGSNAFNQAVFRDRIQSLEPQPVQQDIEPQISPRANQAEENQPLLAAEEQIVDQIIQAQPPAAQQILQENRDRIGQIISLQGVIDNRDKILDAGRYLWEWFYTRPKQQENKLQDMGQTQPVFDDAVPPHCRIQYFWNEQKQKLERIMICNDERRNERVYYGV